MVRCSHRPLITIALDLEVEHQAKQTFLCHLVCQTLLLDPLLGPVILVTDGITKICCRGFIVVLFQCTPANKLASEHSQKL